MCTVTVVRLPGKLIRIAMNRDEKHDRPRGLVPRIGTFGDRRAIFPVDAASGGTWAAVNDSGTAFVLLNRNPHRPHANTRTSLTSRGKIIPSLLHCGSTAHALQQRSNFDGSEFSPFHLIVIDRESVGQIEWDGLRLRTSLRELGGRALMFTSSSLGDALVEPPRRALFESVSFDSAGVQDQFRRHSWPDASHLSVCMRRVDARTVSFSTIELRPESADFVYHDDAPDRPAQRSRATLGLHTPSAV